MPSRKEYASTNGLCFGCLEPGHWSKCVQRGKFVRFEGDYIQHPFTGIPKGKKEMKEAEEVTETLATILDC